ncbi:hypothetical protein HOT99_gp293 [Caulobacter phage CcrBL10]|uniref:Uncharacterized protein n=1 Tax=Caulobacter phage CcrBL10 TaxID=2283269 RepID=A0A385E914_9CAUD|nr:hypothetical protein HOT99_gp293 [Caulobacter phage CcrBL10]AXQ68324.1 hypothetical protein CcrBL10_gp120c [Caulobacter phage CcrBL10]
MNDGVPYENIFRAAADDVARQPLHPGQSLPGVWNLTKETPATVLVVAIVAGALSRLAKARDLEFEPLLRRYVELSPAVPFRPVGAPDLIAKAHLQDVSRYAAMERADAARKLRIVEN